jgi:iron complex outermembrane receptor protein
MKKIFLSTVSAVVSIVPFASAATAQGVADPVNSFHLATASNSAIQPAAAADAAVATQEEAASDPAGESGDIVVTANKRSQNLQDVSLSITALSGADLVNNQITDVTDFGSQLPNVNVSTSLGRAVITIRGMGQAGPLNGRDPAVALHLDGAVISQPAAQLGAFFDLERIEVLRGPQGTLYGRNSTGGVINLISNKPTEHVSGYLRATLGNYDQIGVEGAISGPLIGDKVLGRFAVRTEDRAGLGVNEMSGTDINDVNTHAFRAQIEARPTETFTLLLSGEVYKEADANYVSTYYGPGYPGSTHPALIQRGADFSPNPRNVRSEAEASNKRDTWSLTATADWEMSDTLALRSLTNYRELVNDQVYDFDTSPLVLPTVNNNYQESQQFSEELQLSYGSGPLDAMLTFYYFKEDYIGDSLIGINPIRSAPPHLQRTSIRFFGDVDIDSWAVFGNTRYETGQFTFDIGARYTEETRNGETVTTLGTVVTPYSTGAKSTDFSPKATIEWRPFDGMMAFATFSEGFKSGVIPIGSPNPIVRPELVTNYEVGFKSTWFDRKLVLNAAVFYDKFTDLHVGIGQVSLANPAAVAILLQNAASAVTKGFEAELVWSPSSAFSIDSSIGYVDATFRDYVTVNSLDLPNAQLLDRSGNPLPNAPKWTIRNAAHYNLRLPNQGELSFNAGASYKSKQYFTAFREERLSGPSYTLFDANIRYTSPEETFFANLWAKNITDVVYQTVFLNSTSRQFLTAIGEPRTYGVTLGYNF